MVIGKVGKLEEALGRLEGVQTNPNLAKRLLSVFEATGHQLQNMPGQERAFADLLKSFRA